MRKNLFIAIVSLLFFVQNSFAQNSCGWKQLDFVTRTQFGWDAQLNLTSGVLAADPGIYGSTFGLIEIGIPGTSGYSIRFSGYQEVMNYLAASGSPAALNTDYTDITTTNSGSFGGEVLALKLNVDFSNAGVLKYGNTSFGQLTLHDMTTTTLNGMSVANVLMLANTLLGGGSAAVTITDINPVLADLNAAFRYGAASSFATQHLTSWTQGQLVTYTQIDYGQEVPDQTLLTNYDIVYSPNGISEVGIPGAAGYSLRFSSPNTVLNYFVQSGTPGPLIVDLLDNTSNPSHQFGGEVMALKLNVDFADAEFLMARLSIHFGDLVLHDLTTLPQLNGMTVRQVLDIANILLGGGTSIAPLIDVNNLVAALNGSFYLGYPSQWAQDHLKKGWKQEDMTTRTQLIWDGLTSWYSDYHSVYSATQLIMEIGIPGSSGFSIRFTEGDRVNDFLVQTGTPAALNADLLDPLGSSAGQFGGEMAALTLNIDFSDAEKLPSSSSLHLGDLVFYNMTDAPVLNGKTVRELLSIGNNLLGGGTTNTGLTIADVNAIAAQLNTTFVDGTPSQWAQLHLKSGWLPGDLFTRSQLAWDMVTTWYLDYGDVYASTLGVMEVGLPGSSGFSIRFTSPDIVNSFFVQTGIPAALNADLLDPLTSSAKQFGGEMVAFRLNVDFSDAGKIPASSSFHLGDLVFYNMTDAPVLNGMSVRQFLSQGNSLLGGGTTSTGLTIVQVNDIVGSLNTSFVNGTPSQWAKDHLISPCDAANLNHCPSATNATATTSVNTAANIQLQATDQDNNTLTFSISVQPQHGIVATSSSGAATYTPAAGYYGNDEFKFKANDGNCDGEGTVAITIVMCPKGKGNWINNPNSWPVSATPMMLGTQSYTKQQLITILNTPVGTGNKADASLILAHQLIPAKLSIANGSPSAPIAATITHANGSLAAYPGMLPYKVKPNTPAGQAMIADAIVLENYNNGSMTTGCSATPALTRTNSTAINETSIDEIIGWQVKVYPNPSATIFSITVQADAKGKIMMQVIDMYGRIIETRNVNANSPARFGDRYNPGTYFIRIVQGKEHKEIKLVKVSD